MKIPAGATSYTPPPNALGPGSFRGAAIRHTFRPEGAGDWLLIYTLGGSGLYRLGPVEYHSRPRDVTLYRPGIFQDYQIAAHAKKWDLLFTHFLPRTDWLAWLDWPEIAPGLMLLTLVDTAVRRRVDSRFRDIIRFHAGSQSRSQTFGLNALEEVLLWCDSINPRRQSLQPDPRVRKAIDFLSAHSAEPFSEKRLAHAAGLSPSRLRHLFRAQTGDSPRHFQETQRLLRARDLLSMSRETIGEIALKLGFENPFYFSLRFKKQTGESPRGFRLRTTRQNSPAGNANLPTGIPPRQSGDWRSQQDSITPEIAHGEH